MQTIRCALLLAFMAVGLMPLQPARSQDFSRGNSLVNESARAVDQKHYREGVDLAQQALRSGEVALQNTSALYNNLCIGLTGLRKFDEAITACNKALESNPRAWAIYNNRANVYFYLGQFDRALAEYYKAMTFSAGGTVLMNNISLALQYRRVYGSRPKDAEKSS